MSTGRRGKDGVLPSTTAAPGIGVIAFIHNIAIQRDRADAAALEARAQQRAAEQGRDETTLEHGDLQLRRDPTAAMAILATYCGGDALSSSSVASSA